MQAIIGKLSVEAVYCDAVEFCNPVHDIALPVVRAAVSRSEIPLLEIPLIYQRSAETETYEVQRVPGSLSAESVWTELSDEELGRKMATIKSGVYQMLMGSSAILFLPGPHVPGGSNFLKRDVRYPLPPRSS